MNDNHIVVGLTHIDLGWLKGREEMAELLDIYLEHLCEMTENTPGFHYLLEQALHYKDLKVRNPQLFQRVKKLVRAGSLEFATGVASTIETNVVNGESILRNMQLGLRWIQAAFGTPVVNCAMMDTFGFSPQIPQILRQFGYDCLLASRLGGRNWESVINVHGLDGSKLRVMGRDLMSPFVQPGHLHFRFCTDDNGLYSLFEQAEKSTADWTLVFPYTENEILPSPELLRCMEASSGNYKFATLEEIFERVRRLENVREVSGDLNPEFTGTYSLRHRLRIQNRQCERLLLDAEAVCAILADEKWDHALEECWWEMAYTQFHDIITGSHPTAVYNDCLERMDSICNTASAVIQGALLKRGEAPSSDSDQHMTLINTLPFERQENLSWTLPNSWNGVESVLVNGTAAAFRQTGNQITILATSPPMSMLPVTIKRGESAPALRRSLQVLENEDFRIELGEHFVIDRILFKPCNQVLMEQVNDILLLQKDTGSFQVEDVSNGEIPCAAGTYAIRCFQEGESQTAEISGSFPGMEGNPVTYVLTLTITSGQPWIALDVQASWHVEGMRLRLKLPTPFQAADGLYEVPFGVTKRQPYRATQNSRGEWPAFRFAAIEDLLSKSGIALINSGVAGVECLGGSIYTTLLRAPTTECAGMAPDDTSSDHGEHSFHFIVYAYENGWEDSNLLPISQAFNQPLQLVPGTFAAEPSFMRFDNRRIVLSSVKRTCGGKIALRFYESTGTTQSLRLFLRNGVQVWQSDARELPLEPITTACGAVDLVFSPFEIRTILL